MARFWDWLVGRPLATAPASPYTDGGDLVTITVKEMFGDALPDLMTRDIAARVGGLRRALSAHLAIAGTVVWREWDNAVMTTPQPKWLTWSDSGVSPYHRTLGLVTDLYWYGWAVLGCELDADDGVADALHVPYGYWTVDQTTGEIRIDGRIEARYRQRVVAIPLGMNGVLVDGHDVIEDARWIARAVRDRLANPIPQTELHLTDDVNLSARQKRKLAEEYNEGRKLEGGATSVTPHNVEVKLHGTIAPDLFESGRNANRLDLANVALVPASFIEGSRASSAGQMTYSNEDGKRAELHDFGTALFLNAIAARLSLDDVSPSGRSIRADLSAWASTPTPATSTPTED